MPVSVARGFESPGRVQDREAQRATSAGDVSTGHVTSGQAAASGESETKDGNGVSATSLVAGAAAAATSSVIGGQLGVAGTVLGAGLASVVTAVAVTFYSRGLDKGREKVQKAVAKIGPVPNTKDERTIAIVTEEPLTWRQKLRRKRVLYPVVIGAATFLVGIGAVVVAEQVTENDVSPGTSQISRSITGDASGGEGTSGTGETGAGETGTGDTGGSSGSGSSAGGAAGSGGSGGGAGGDANSQGRGSMESGSGSGSDTSAQGAGQRSGTADDA